MFITRAHHNIDWPMQKEKKLAGKETGWDRMTTLGNFSSNDKSLTWLTGRLRTNAGEICPLYRYLSKPCSLLQLHRAVKWSLWDSTNMAWQSWQNLWQAEDMNSFHFLAANQAATSITTFFFCVNEQSDNCDGSPSYRKRLAVYMMFGKFLALLMKTIVKVHVDHDNASYFSVSPFLKWQVKSLLVS